MRTPGSATELQGRRILAVERFLDGFDAAEIADFLGVSASSVRRWIASFRRAGMDGLTANAVPGRPRKLTRTQEKVVLRWLDGSPTEHGFDTELWTAARLAELIRQEWGVELNRRYVCRWLRACGFTPQRPQRIPRERSSEAIAAWLNSEWGRLKKKRRASAGRSFRLTKAGC